MARKLIVLIVGGGLHSPSASLVIEAMWQIIKVRQPSRVIFLYYWNTDTLNGLNLPVVSLQTFIYLFSSTGTINRRYWRGSNTGGYHTYCFSPLSLETDILVNESNYTIG